MRCVFVPDRHEVWTNLIIFRYRHFLANSNNSSKLWISLGLSKLTLKYVSKVVVDVTLLVLYKTITKWINSNKSTRNIQNIKYIFCFTTKLRTI